MTFREKTLWVSLVSTVLVWGWYFSAVLPQLVSGRITPAPTFGGFIYAVVMLTAIQVVAAIVIALWRPSEAEVRADARDRDFSASAARPAYAVLSVLIVMIMLAVPSIILAAPRLDPGAPAGMLAAIYIANAMLGALVIAHLVYAGWQLARYRRES